MRVTQHAGDELVAEFRELEAIGVGLGLEQVGAGFEARQRHVEVRAAAGTVGEGLGHEGGEVAAPLGEFADHEAEEGEAVGHGQRVGVLEVGLELAVGVLVVEGIDVPAQPVHRLHDLVEHRIVVEKTAHVVAGFGQRVAGAGRHQPPVGLLLQHEELGLDAEVEAVAHRRRGGKLLFQDAARAGLEGLPLEMEIARVPDDFGVPRQDRAGSEVGVGGDFLVVDFLRHAVERGAGEEFRAADHLVEMRQRHDLALGHAVQVDEARERIFHAGGLEPGLRGLGFERLGFGRGMPGHADSLKRGWGDAGALEGRALGERLLKLLRELRDA